MRSLNMSIVLLGLLFVSSAHSLEIGMFRLDAHLSAGHNGAQGTYGALGADFYMPIDENFVVGIGGYYAAGEHPSRDREIGAGPFGAFVFPLIEDWISFSAREDLDYIDSRQPLTFYDTNPVSYGYKNNYGMAAITTVGMHFHLTKGFGVSAGYRWALALNNSDLAKGRSGLFFGLGFSI